MSVVTSDDQRDDPLAVVRVRDFLANLATATHHRGPVGDLDDVVHGVRDDDDGPALVAQAQRRGRLIQDDDLGGERGGAGHRDRLPLPTRHQAHIGPRVSDANLQPTKHRIGRVGHLGLPHHTQAPRQPPADQILDRYIQLVGGTQPAGFTSYVANGLFRGFDDSEQTPVEIYGDAMGRRATIVHGLSGVTTTTYDGRAGWIAGPPTDRPFPLIAVTGQELEGLKLEAELFFPSRIKQTLRNWRVGFPTEINDREVQVVQGTTAGGGVATLCFDAQTGLLVRMIRYGASPVGRIVTRVDYSDYRDVGNVKMPFKWTVSWLDGRSTFELAKVQPNVPIDAAKFAKPVVK